MRQPGREVCERDVCKRRRVRSPRYPGLLLQSPRYPGLLLGWSGDGPLGVLIGRHDIDIDDLGFTDTL